MTQPDLGDYFYWKAPNSPKHHYCFVLNNPDTQGDVLIVNMTSQPRNKQKQFDTACILKPGDEPFVKHDSYVFYKRIQTMKAAQVTSIVLQRRGNKCGKLKPATLQKVLHGARITTEMDLELQQKHFP